MIGTPAVPTSVDRLVELAGVALERGYGYSHVWANCYVRLPVLWQVRAGLWYSNSWIADLPAPTDDSRSSAAVALAAREFAETAETALWRPGSEAGMLALTEWQRTIQELLIDVNAWLHYAIADGFFNESAFSWGYRCVLLTNCSIRAALAQPFGYAPMQADNDPEVRDTLADLWREATEAGLLPGDQLLATLAAPAVWMKDYDATAPLGKFTGDAATDEKLAALAMKLIQPWLPDP